MKAYEENLECITLSSGADLSEKQFRFVKVDSTGRAVLAGAGEGAIGVTQDKKGLDLANEIAISGVTRVVSGGAITAGASVEVGADGKAVAFSTGTKVGTALIGSAGDGQFISVLLKVQ